MDEILERSHRRAHFFWKILPRKLPACSPLPAAAGDVSRAGRPAERSRERWEGLRVRFGGNAPHRHLSASCFVPMTPAHSHSTGTFMHLKKESVCQGETDASLLCALRAALPRVPRRREDARASGAATTGGQWFRELAHHDLLPVPPKPRNLGSGQK